MLTPERKQALLRELPALAVLVVVLGGILGLVALLVDGAGEILEAVNENDGLATWDRPVLDWAIANRAPGLTDAVLWFTHTGGPIWQPIIFFGLAGLLAWRWRDWTPLVLVALAEGGALAIAEVGKDVIGRARPPESDAVPPFETSPSFPSGHTIEAFVIATMLTYLLVRHLWDRSAVVKVLIGVVAFVYACAMGFSRVFLGYHWLTDVFAAAMLGVAWAGVVIAMHRVWRMVRKRRERGPVEEETVTRTELS